jgi:hypothetical protein
LSALAELAKPVDDLVWLAEIDAARLDAGDDDATGGPALVVETLMVASRPFVTDAVLDHPPATPIEGRFSPNFSASWELSASADTGFPSLPTFQIGQMEFANTDGALDDWLDLYAVQGREVRVSAATWLDVAGRTTGPGGDAFLWQDGAGGFTTWTDSTPGGAPEVLWVDSTARGRVGGSGLSAFRRLFKGRVRSWSFSGGRIVVLVDPDARQLDNPVQVATYDGTGGLGGTAELAGRTKPKALGIRKGIEPPLIDPVRLIYQANDGAIHGISDVRDVGISLAFTRDYDSYALLAAAVQQSLDDDDDPGSFDIGIGQYATCLVEGVFRLGGPAAGRVICDVQGSSFVQRVEIPWKSGHTWRSGHGWRTFDFKQAVEVSWVGQPLGERPRVVGQGRAAVLLGRPPHGAAAADRPVRLRRRRGRQRGHRPPERARSRRLARPVRRLVVPAGRQHDRPRGVVPAVPVRGRGRVPGPRRHLACEVSGDTGRGRGDRARRVDAGAGQPGAGGPSLAGPVGDLEVRLRPQLHADDRRRSRGRRPGRHPRRPEHPRLQPARHRLRAGR